VVARALRDAGMEVIYTGLRQTPEQIVSAVVEEDANVLGLSILSGAHDFLFPRIIELLKQEGRNDVLVVAGGIFPPEDLPGLKDLGIAGVFGPGADTGAIVSFINQNLPG
jgi:methylmalonyl-CoA mutase, C-terminal domain